MPPSEPNARREEPGLTLRAVVIAVFLTLFLTASSSYIAIKLGALPWPIILSVILSGGLVKALSAGRAIDIHEINVAQAGASVGGLVAAGIVFTVPGILYLNAAQGLEIPWPPAHHLAMLTVVAGVLGVLLSIPLKRTFVDQEKLPYPSGTAGAELLLLAGRGGPLLTGIICTGAMAGLFALARDLYFPAGFSLHAAAAAGFFVTLYPMPLAVGSGFILGGRAGFSWLAGASVGWLVLVPLLVLNDFAAAGAREVAQNLGMGLVLGSGIGFFAAYVAPRLRPIFAPYLNTASWLNILIPLLSICAGLVLWQTGVPPLAAVLAVVLTWIMVAVAGRMTGETNINPLEQFGIFTGLVIALVYSLWAMELPMYASFMIVVFVSVACAVAGDVGHDYKSAALVGTRFSDIVKVDLIAVVFAGAAAPFVLELIRSGFAETLFTEAMPAPQAQLVAGSIFGFGYPWVFLAGFLLAFFLEIGKRRWPGNRPLNVMMMPLGIGLFLGMGLALPIALGAIIRIGVDRRRPALGRTGIVIAAGVMGGEGIAGFCAGALIAAGVAASTAAIGLAAVLLPVAAISAALGIRNRDGKGR